MAVGWLGTYIRYRIQQGIERSRTKDLAEAVEALRAGLEQQATLTREQFAEHNRLWREEVSTIYARILELAGRDRNTSS